MTLDQIDNMTLEDNLWQMIHRLVDIVGLPEGEALLTLDEDDLLSDYDRIIINPIFIKPTLEELEAELILLKAELTAIEDARLAEIARVQDINDRWSAMTDIRAVTSIQNPALELKRIIRENDQAALETLEAAWVIHNQDMVVKAAEQQADEMLSQLLDSITGCIKIVAKFNMTSGLTSIQKDDQEEMYADVFKALKDYRPGKFKKYVTALIPDKTLVTQTLKDELLNYLTSRGI